MLKVALIDESLRMQQALRMLLSTVGGLEIVGTAVDAAGALELLEEVQPDVFVIDVELRDGGGHDLLRSIAGAERPPEVVVMTRGGSAERRDAFLAAGAEAFFDKAGDGLELTHWMRGRVALTRRGLASKRQPTERFLPLPD